MLSVVQTSTDREDQKENDWCISTKSKLKYSALERDVYFYKERARVDVFGRTMMERLDGLACGEDGRLRSMLT